MFHGVYQNRRVLVTGHTGFKGSWLCAWLQMMGAEVCGVSLPMETEYSHHRLLNPDFRSEICDIRDYTHLLSIFDSFQPDIVFHLAAQPLVRLSYAQPVETFSSNVMGTVHVLESCRSTSSVKSVVVISSDKCYENIEKSQGYRETDPLGGFDPYSASKGCTEIAAASYRRSFFPPDGYGRLHHTLLASARAGNVIGGGDWAKDRLIPDLVRAAVSGQNAEIRSPDAVRPWQHVLEPLSGYLLLGELLWEGKPAFSDSWNFGPDERCVIPVKSMAEAMAEQWNRIRFSIHTRENQPHEANLLFLDCTKARTQLHWKTVLSSEETFQMTAEWYRMFYEKNEVITQQQIEQYIAAASERNAEWTK